MLSVQEPKYLRQKWVAASNNMVLLRSQGSTPAVVVASDQQQLQTGCSRWTRGKELKRQVWCVCPLHLDDEWSYLPDDGRASTRVCRLVFTFGRDWKAVAATRRSRRRRDLQVCFSNSLGCYRSTRSDFEERIQARRRWKNIPNNNKKTY